MIKKVYDRSVKRMYDWAMNISAKPNAVWLLVVISFIESSFFPIPPDIILIPLILANREKAFMLAMYCTVSSVLGGYFGYFIGYVLYDSVAVPILDFYNYQKQFEELAAAYHKYGAWIVFGAGFTPFPYKIVTIASGVVHLDLSVFGIVSVLARGGRFFFVAWLLWKWGAPMKIYIEKNLGWLSVLFFILLVGSFALIKIL